MCFCKCCKTDGVSRATFFEQVVTPMVLATCAKAETTTKTTGTTDDKTIGFTTSKTQVAKTLDSTYFSQKTVAKTLTVDISKNNVAGTNDVSNTV